MFTLGKNQIVLSLPLWCFCGYATLINLHVDHVSGHGPFTETEINPQLLRLSSSIHISSTLSLSLKSVLTLDCA